MFSQNQIITIMEAQQLYYMYILQLRLLICFMFVIISSSYSLRNKLYRSTVLNKPGVGTLNKLSLHRLYQNFYYSGSPMPDIMSVVSPLYLQSLTSV